MPKRVLWGIGRWCGVGVLALGLLASGCDEFGFESAPEVPLSDSARPGKKQAQRGGKRGGAERRRAAPEVEEQEPEDRGGSAERAAPEEDLEPGRSPAAKDRKQKEPREQKQARRAAPKKLPPGVKTRKLKRMSESGGGAMSVRKAAIATSIEDRKPVGSGKTFSADVEKLWAYVGVKNDEAPSHITMVWKRNGKERSRVKLKVGTSPYWRTWSSKVIDRKKDPGKWTVEVQDAAGQVIKTMSFELRASS